MTILYNCHTDGDQHRITKFNDGEVEASYLCSETECQCPAGHRPTCRHRMMLPMFLHRGAVDSWWFLDWDRKGWVSNEPAELLETRLATKPLCERSELDSSNPEPASLLSNEQLEAITNERLTPLPERYIVEGNPTKPPWRRI